MNHVVPSLAINKNPIYLTTGEPTGIGPEIALQAAKEQMEKVGAFTIGNIPIVLLGDLRMLKARAQVLGIDVDLVPFTSKEEILKEQIPVLDISLNVPSIPGQLDTQNASYVLKQLEMAAKAATTGEASAIVTGPVQKSVINDAGIPFTGHTEFFQNYAKVSKVVMMLAAGSLRVALATTHLPLREVSDAITRPLLREVLSILSADMKNKFGIEHPRILVCGLNPHAGEGGHLGREEIDVIEPVLSEFRAKGINVGHSMPADTLFTPRHLQNADAVLAMYHDQGLPVLKHAGFGEAVNLTLGLPFIRTSVDHGTALDLAGTGKANHHSLNAALNLASELIQKT